MRRAARLTAPEGRLLLVSVAELEVAVEAGWAAATVADQLREEAHQALEVAQREIADVRSAELALLEGPVATALLGAAESEQATLLCVGTHGHRRASGILLGGTVTTVVHDAATSVLVARPVGNPGTFPSRIVVGLDGSPEAAAAAAVATELTERSGASLRRILASRGKEVDSSAVALAYPDVDVVDSKPVDALVSASEDADLLVVGSKGLHGVRALGSVSERVAHRSRCSVLVARR